MCVCERERESVREREREREREGEREREREQWRERANLRDLVVAVQSICLSQRQVQLLFQGTCPQDTRQTTHL